MSDKYHRLVTFVVDICTSVLCEAFLYCARKDTTVPGGYLTTNSYMLAKQQSVDNLVKCKAIRKDQYKKIYQNSGTCSESDWDISLLMSLLFGLFGVQISNKQAHLYKIRDIRNALLHESGSARVSDADFNTMWGDLKIATLALAKRTKGAHYETEVDQKISEALASYMPGLAETLRLWHKSDSEEQADTIRQLNETVCDLRENVENLQKKVDNIEQSSSSTCSMIKRGSVLGQDSSGKPVKKFKTVDDILEKLKGNFRGAMTTDLYEEFTAPKEIAEIRNKLRTKHRVVLTGCRGSAYFQTALYVIKDMDCNIDKCVLLTHASEWIHIDPAEIDVVLFKHPIGETSLDEAKLSAMADISQSILSSTNNTAKMLTVIIVLRVDIFKEAKLRIDEDHELFQETMILYEDTTAENPEDLVADTMAFDKHGTAEYPIKTLIEMTEVYIAGIECARCDESVLRDAKEKMRIHKAIVLTGPSTFVTNSVLIELVKSYSPGTRLLLTNPDDLRYVQLNKISLLVIESMSGKYQYDAYKAQRWFESFDMLLVLVRNRKLNLIITAEKERFKSSLIENGQHGLVQHVVDIDNSSISRGVKQDSADDATTNDNSSNHNTEKVDPKTSAYKQVWPPVSLAGGTEHSLDTTRYDPDSMEPYISTRTKVSSTDAPMTSSERVDVVPSVSDTSSKLSFTGDIGGLQYNDGDDDSDVSDDTDDSDEKDNRDNSDNDSDHRDNDINDTDSDDTGYLTDASGYLIMGSINGVTVVSDKYLVALTDKSFNNSTLNSFNNNTMSRISEYKLNTRSHDITTVGYDQVAVTLPNMAVIQLIRIDHAGHMSFVRDIQAGEGHGIVYNLSSNTLIVTYMYVIPRIQILDMSGNVLSTIRNNNSLTQFFSHPSYIALSRDNTTIYVTDLVANTITAMSLTGQVTKVVKDEKLLYASGVTVGDDGCVYVCSELSNTVCQWNPHSGTPTTLLLDESDGLTWPRSVVFCERSKRLYVGSYGKIKMYPVNY